LRKIILFDGRLVETAKHTHKGTSFTNRQWRCTPKVHKGTFGAKRNAVQRVYRRRHFQTAAVGLVIVPMSLKTDVRQFSTQKRYAPEVPL